MAPLARPVTKMVALLVHQALMLQGVVVLVVQPLTQIAPLVAQAVAINVQAVTL